MSRLLDRLLVQRSGKLAHYGSQNAIFPQSQETLENSVQVLTDSVAELVYTTKAGGDWDIQHDFNIVLPTLSPMFLAYRMPKKWLGSDGNLHRMDVGAESEVGALSVTEDMLSMTPVNLASFARNRRVRLEDRLKVISPTSLDAWRAHPVGFWTSSQFLLLLPFRRESVHTLIQRISRFGAMDTLAKATAAQNLMKEGELARFTVDIGFWFENGRDSILSPFGFEYGVMPNGSLSDESVLFDLYDPEFHFNADPNPTVVDEGLSRYQGYAENFLLPFLFAVNLSHCKNVKLMPSAPVPAKVAKAQMKRHGRVTRPYFFLDLVPFKAIMQSQGQMSAVGVGEHGISYEAVSQHIMRMLLYLECRAWLVPFGDRSTCEVLKRSARSTRAIGRKRLTGPATRRSDSAGLTPRTQLNTHSSRRPGSFRFN